LRWPRNTFYTQMLALTTPTSGGRSVGIVRLRTTATELIIIIIIISTSSISIFSPRKGWRHFIYSMFICIYFLFLLTLHLALELLSKKVNI
jgi:hypothetical protein